MYKHWTVEEEDFIKICTEQGWTAKEIAYELDRSEGSVIARRNRMGIKGRNGAPKKYTKEELLELLRNAPIKTYEYLNSKESKLPAATTYRSYFGSWQNALTEAGIENNFIMNPTKTTTVYLVEFDGFYKVGITQRPISKRLDSRYPKYEVVMSIDTTLEQAREIEKTWLEAVKSYKYVPDCFPKEHGGHTECFKLV
jgi:transposase